MKTYEEGFIAGFSHNIKTVEELEERIKEAIGLIDLIIPELWNINNHMTYKLKEIKKILKGE
jgi:predicted RNase H-like HicB family nuclease